MSEKVQCLHPQGKQGVRIARSKYDPIRNAIMRALRDEGPCTFTDLVARVENRLENDFPGSVSWYTISVKLDLEARGEVERVKHGKSELVALPSK